jgi:hypothetical protein
MIYSADHAALRAEQEQNVVAAGLWLIFIFSVAASVALAAILGIL